MKDSLRAIVLTLVGILVTGSVRADWSVDGNAVSTADDLQMNPVIISDGGVGTIVAWQDRRDGTFSIYVQKLDASGNALWTSDGVAVCVEANDQTDPRLVSDGAGGAILVWEDARTSTNFDVYVQRVDTDGNPLWTTDGVVICALDLNQQNPAIVSDASGGAIVVWQDNRNGLADIFAQRVDAVGDTLWMADGVAVCTVARAQINPVAVADGLGGVIATWVDRRADLGDIYAQRLDASGTALWKTDGVALCAATADQTVPVLVSDISGGAIVAWADNRKGDRDIYAQRVRDDGAPQWDVDGVALCAEPDDQNNPTIVSDFGATAFSGVVGGAIVAWEDKRNGFDYNIYAAHVNSVGDRAWTPDGVALCTAPLNQVKPAAAKDADSGAIVAWEDHRPNFHADVYARRVDMDGSPQWAANGILVCGAAGDQLDPAAALGDAGSAIVVWEDLRTGSYDVYAQRALGPPTAVAITSFDATAEAGAVTLRAGFRSDLTIEGVRVYRGDNNGALQRIADAGASANGFEYVDRDVAPGAAYRYQIGVVDPDGEFFSPIVAVSVAALAQELDQNRPNPFNPSTTIRFVVPVRERVSLVVYDASGRTIRTLVDEAGVVGAHDAIWDGRDDHGIAQSSGVYFYRLQVGTHTDSKKMLLLK